MTVEGIGCVEVVLTVVSAPFVPDGLFGRAMYPYRFFCVFPQVSEGYPGHGSLHPLASVAGT